MSHNKNERIRILFADQLNLARGKYVPLSFAEKGSVRFCVGAYAVTYAKQLVAAPGSGVTDGLPDMEAVFDPVDIRESWEDNSRFVLADLRQHDQPCGLCGRSALKKAIAAWQAKGLIPMIGLEGEAYIFQRDEQGQWVPYDTPGAFVYGTGPFSDPAGLVDEIWEMAHRIGLPIESMNAEYDSPQFELTLGYADALKACDDFFLFRTMARELLYKRGYLLSFLPKPLADKGGNGLHINLSFTDENGKNVLADGTAKDALSDLVKGSIAGLLHHHQALGAIMAPIVNSYDRLQPASMNGYWANWGYDHRAVAVRVSSETGNAARIEHRLADCAASPYVAVAAVLQAALLGVEQGYDLPDPETGDGFEKVNTDIGIAQSLEASLDLLEANTELTKAIGKPLIDNYIGIKRAEVEELQGADAQQVFDYYAPFI